jgi:aromatic-L-amino-acid/L-tryptophan decarboxylase
VSAIHPLEPDGSAMTAMGHAVVERVVAFVESLHGRPATPPAGSGPAEDFLAPPPEEAGDLESLLGRLDQATDHAIETAGPGMLAYVPGGGLYTSALGEFYARAVNRFAGLAATAPALVALEESVLRWIARDVCGLPAGSGGLLTTGGSMANFSAVVAARHARLGEELGDGTVYVTAHTHHSAAKAARLAGIRRRNVRVVPCDDELRMDVDAAAAMIRADRAAGLRPFLLVASAGTTDIGAIDPLRELAALTRREDLWLHVDAAYGGFFRLTERGRSRLAGTELADSVTLDPHKTLFLPFGTGALVVRDRATLLAAHDGTGRYLQDTGPLGELPDYSAMGPELSRENRGLRVWLPLHLHGVGAFRAALDEKLDLAELVYGKLSAMPSLEVPWRPGLTAVAFRVRPRGEDEAALAAADAATRRLLSRVNADGRVLLSSTVTERRQTVRVCVVAHRTHVDRVADALDLIAAAAAEENVGAVP